MRNCFPPLPLPDQDFVTKNIEDEYEEMTMDEILNGRVKLNYMHSHL